MSSSPSLVLQNGPSTESAAEPRGASSAATLPANECVTEEVALQAVAELLEFIDTAGLASLSLTHADNSLQRWRRALATLSHSVPFNGMIADALLERVSAAFADALRAFQDALQLHSSGKTKAERHLSHAVVAPALEALCAAYDQVFPLLQEWCEILCVPGVASFFSVHVRGVLLQADLISGEEPRQKRALLAFLREYGHDLLSHDLRNGGAARGAEEDGAARLTADKAVDPVIRCLHRLTLSQSNEIKHLWRSVLEARIRERLRDLSDDFSTHFLHEQMAWLGDCVLPFVAMVLDVEEEGASRKCGDSSSFVLDSGAGHARRATARVEQESWCADMRHLFLRSYARRRLASFWEILSDYPDSVPALEDMQYCLQAYPEGGLKTELVQTVRHLLSSRLHRAGTRTEDILAILINTINAFCVLFSRNEQNSVVFAVIAGTLDHLRKRKDCVTAIVQAIMQPNGAMNASASPPLPTSSTLPNYDDDRIGGSSGGVGDTLDLQDYFHDGQSGEGGEDLYRTTSRDRPDVLRVLLTSIHRRALVEEYQHVLAEQLLQKPMHDFDTTPEEEVLERLKQVFGESVLDRCAVMVRDMQMSRRMTQQLREQLARRRVAASRSDAKPNADAVRPASVSVLSMTTWPPLSRCSAVPGGDVAGGASGAHAVPPKYRPHPSLQAEMDSLADIYKRLKENQRLEWLPSLGRVELDLIQRDPSKGNALVTIPHVLSLFDASVVLFAKELTGSDASITLSKLASTLEVSVEDLRPHVQALTPALLILTNSEMVSMQRSVASSKDFVFVEETAEEADGKPAGLPPERVTLMERMITSLLKTRGPQATTAIHSSLKLLAKFEGTPADLVELLQSFVKRGFIVLNEAKLYALPPK